MEFKGSAPGTTRNAATFPRFYITYSETVYVFSGRASHLLAAVVNYSLQRSTVQSIL